MEEFENKENRQEEVFSRIIRAGKRTYFFDVKATRAGENYLTITESKRRFTMSRGSFSMKNIRYSSTGKILKNS